MSEKVIDGFEPNFVEW